MAKKRPILFRSNILYLFIVSINNLKTLFTYKVLKALTPIKNSLPICTHKKSITITSLKVQEVIVILKSCVLQINNSKASPENCKVMRYMYNSLSFFIMIKFILKTCRITI